MAAFIGYAVPWPVRVDLEALVRFVESQHGSPECRTRDHAERRRRPPYSGPNGADDGSTGVRGQCLFDCRHSVTRYGLYVFRVQMSLTYPAGGRRRYSGPRCVDRRRRDLDRTVRFGDPSKPIKHRRSFDRDIYL